MEKLDPTLGNGKICYLEIPAEDISHSSSFYQKTLGWSVRRRRDGSIAFDDGVGEVSGTWVLGKAPSRNPSLRIYIMVDDVEATLQKIVLNGGKVVEPANNHPAGIIAFFSDPYGNEFGLFQDNH